MLFGGKELTSENKVNHDILKELITMNSKLDSIHQLMLERESLIKKCAMLANPDVIGAMRGNYKVFNDQTNPLFNSVVNFFNFGLKSPGTSRANSSFAGKLYCAVSGSVTITQNNYYAFYISNPSGSGITAQFDIIECTTK